MPLLNKNKNESSDADVYNNREIAYYFKRGYEKLQKDVEKAQSLGKKIHPEFLDELRTSKKMGSNLYSWHSWLERDYAVPFETNWE